MKTLNMGGDDGSGQMGFRNRVEMMLNCPSSGMNTRSLPEKIAPMTVSSLYSSDWDPMVSLSQSGSFGGVSSMASQGNLIQGITSSSQLDSYPSDPSFAQMLPKVSMLESGSFSEFVNPYDSPGFIQNSNAPVPQDYPSNKSRLDEKLSANAVQAENDCQISKGKDVVESLNGKRKQNTEPSTSNKVADKDQQKHHSGETSGQKEPDDKRQKHETNEVGNSSATQTGKQRKDNSQEEEAPKQNYIHVRARRGQATNSHSLAERVRREKISERMRLLQELVPGCNKITGKALMLDEIINYVQSLQQQVEFLSMKLAAVSPELNFDIDRLLSKDLLHSRGNDCPFIGFDQGMSSSHGLTHGLYQGNLTTMPNSAAQYHHMSQAVWDGDLQNLLHMGFDPNPAVGSLGPNGRSKTEQ